jgi:hypothetical protein
MRLAAHFHRASKTKKPAKYQYWRAWGVLVFLQYNQFGERDSNPHPLFSEQGFKSYLKIFVCTGSSKNIALPNKFMFTFVLIILFFAKDKFNCQIGPF